MTGIQSGVLDDFEIGVVTRCMTVGKEERSGWECVLDDWHFGRGLLAEQRAVIG